MTTPFLTARWENLILANFACDPAILKPYLPPGTELDDWQGVHYISLVGFRFTDTRIFGMHLPGHIDFTEINLRFYVRRREGEAWRHGVVFLKEIVSLPFITLGARLFYGEPYATRPTHFQWQTAPGSLEVRYEWRIKGSWNRLHVLADPNPQPFQAGSEAEFFTQKPWGYSRKNSLATREYAVDHAHWQVYGIKTFDSELAGMIRSVPVFAGALSAPPRSVFLAEGSSIAVYPKSIVGVTGSQADKTALT